MKAIQFQQFGSADVLEYITLPDPVPAAGEILIRVEAAGVNYADIMRRENAAYPFPTSLPFIPGSEVAGVVAALGEGVQGPPVGTPVFALAGTGSTGYAQYVVTPAQQVIPIPTNISFEQASALPVAGTTAVLLLTELARLQPGESILVQGASGGVGSYAVQIAKLLGAGLVIGATSSPAKQEQVLELGADHAVDYTRADWPDRVRELTGGRGVDVILEMSGGEQFINGLKALAPFGRSVVYGMASLEPLSFDHDSIMRFFYTPSLNQSIHVFNLGLWFGLRTDLAAKALGQLIGYVAAGQVKVQVNHVLPLAEAAEAHRMIEQRRTTGKVVLKPWI